MDHSISLINQFIAKLLNTELQNDRNKRLEVTFHLLFTINLFAFSLPLEADSNIDCDADVDANVDAIKTNERSYTMPMDFVYDSSSTTATTPTTRQNASFETSAEPSSKLITFQEHVAAVPIVSNDPLATSPTTTSSTSTTAAMSDPQSSGALLPSSSNPDVPLSHSNRTSIISCSPQTNTESSCPDNIESQDNNDDGLHNKIRNSDDFQKVYEDFDDLDDLGDLVHQFDFDENFNFRDGGKESESKKLSKDNATTVDIKATFISNDDTMERDRIAINTKSRSQNETSKFNDNCDNVHQENVSDNDLDNNNNNNSNSNREMEGRLDNKESNEKITDLSTTRSSSMSGMDYHAFLEKQSKQQSKQQQPPQQQQQENDETTTATTLTTSTVPPATTTTATMTMTTTTTTTITTSTTTATPTEASSNATMKANKRLSVGNFSVGSPNTKGKQTKFGFNFLKPKSKHTHGSTVSNSYTSPATTTTTATTPLNGNGINDKEQDNESMINTDNNEGELGTDTSVFEPGIGFTSPQEKMAIDSETMSCEALFSTTTSINNTEDDNAISKIDSSDMNNTNNNNNNNN
eukprot:Awhi_evm1s3356